MKLLARIKARFEKIEAEQQRRYDKIVRFLEDGLKALPQRSQVCEICGQTNEHCRIRIELCNDHDHKTNRWRGLLCTRCNSALGYFEQALQGTDRGHYPTTDAWMFSAFRYLKRYGSNWKVRSR